MNKQAAIAPNIEQDFYDTRWKEATVSDRDRRRVEFTLNSIPAICRTMVDVGAGDGRLSHALAAAGKHVVAVDISPVALSKLSVPHVCASADDLKFADRSFDLVLSTEMMEHLPETVYQGARKEFARVADKHILITVPNREDLTEQTSRCGCCGTLFHVWGHVRRYEPADLAHMFPGFSPALIVPFGDVLPCYSPALLWVRQKIAGEWAWDDTSPCPKCSKIAKHPVRFPLLARLCGAINRRTYAKMFRRNAWLLALYRRVDSV